jgi:ParB family transcriptional regulator, chromosome partitioning protein
MNEPIAKSNNRGLGRGLSALLGDTQPIMERSNDESSLAPPKEMPIELIRPNPNQPRRTFEADELSALAETIKAHGIVQPIVIREEQSTPGYYSIIAGERRWRAAQIAGLHTVPVVLRNFDDLQTLQVAIVENLQRQNLNAIEEAMAFGQLMDRFGYNQQNIADVIGKSRAYVANTIRLLGLPREVQDMVINGTLSAGHARAALSAPDPLAAANEMVSKNLSVREAENLVNKTQVARKNVSRETKVDLDARALADDLSAVLGLIVDIKHRGEKGGLLQITYQNLEQLDEICRKLSI